MSFGLVEGRARAEIYGGVRPDQRGQGLGTEIMDRMEARALELAGQRHPGVPVLLRVAGGIEGASVRPMLERRGYAVVRYYHELARPIPGVLRRAAGAAGAPLLRRTGRAGPAGPQRRLQHPLGLRPDDGRAVAGHARLPDVPAGLLVRQRGLRGRGAGLRAGLPVGGRGGLGAPGRHPAAGPRRGTGPGLPGRGGAGDGRAGFMRRRAWGWTRRTPPAPGRCTPRWASRCSG